MIVIYTQDETYIKPTADAALPILISFYGPMNNQTQFNQSLDVYGEYRLPLTHMPQTHSLWR